MTNSLHSNALKTLLILTLCLPLGYVSNAVSSTTEPDKKLHLGYSTAIGSMSTFVFEKKSHQFLACSSVGLVKELYDEYRYGGYGNLAGCAIGMTLGNSTKRFILRPNRIEFNYLF